MAITDLCEGCVTKYQGGFIHCSIIKFSKDCPCGDCLVKAMCIEPCEPYDAFYAVSRKKRFSCCVNKTTNLK